MVVEHTDQEVMVIANAQLGLELVAPAFKTVILHRAP